MIPTLIKFNNNLNNTKKTKMDKDRSLLIASAVFGIVAVFHLLISIFNWYLTIGDFNVPIYVNYIAVFVAGYLSFSMYKASTIMG
jgi:hypothetical protein